MPPRKSNISQISATDPDGGGTPVKERDGINIEDLSLPRTMVQRLAKGVLPPNTSLHKDAILAMSKGATVFINYLAQAASHSTTNANKRTIPPPAVLEALIDLEFDAFVPRVEAELKRFSEVQVGKRNEYRRKVKEGKMGGPRGVEKGGEGIMGEVGDDGEGEEEAGRERKRVRRNEEGEMVVGEEGMEGEGSSFEAGMGVGMGLGNGVSGDGHEQLMVENLAGEEEEEEEEMDQTNEEIEDQRRREGGDDDVEDEVKEDEVKEDEEEDEDDDEYPDEGRRLSSVEREAHEGVEGRSPRDEEAGSSEDEGGSDGSD